MAMEDEILPSSSRPMAASSSPQPRRDMWASVHEQPADVDREEAEEWEQIMWLLHPLPCASPPLSFATVQWDVPDPAAEMSFIVTDGNMEDEVGAGSRSPPLPDDQEERDDDWRLDLLFLHPVLQRTGSDSEVGRGGEAMSSHIWTACGVALHHRRCASSRIGTGKSESLKLRRSANHISSSNRQKFSNFSTITPLLEEVKRRWESWFDS